MPLFIFTFRSELYLLCDMYMYVYVSSASASISPMRYMYLNKGFLVHYFFSFLLAHQKGKAMHVL